MAGKSDVVVTGIGLATPLGCEVVSFWDQIVAGASGVRPIERFSAADLPVHIAGEVRGWEETSASRFDSKDRRRLDRYSQFALWSAHQAMLSAGIDTGTLDLDRCGVALGSAIGGIEEYEEQHVRLLESGSRRVSPFMIPKMLVNTASGLISIEYGFRGPTTCVVTACASANHSIIDALRMIRGGEADLMLAGGAEAAIVPTTISGFARMSALSMRSDNPASASRPWDRQRDGFVMAEGAAVFVLESAAHAARHGRSPRARLMGGGISSDGYHITSPREDGAGAAMAMRKAIADAGLTPDDIDYINAHGTSTPQGDLAETRAVHAVFGPSEKCPPLSSTKSQLGHLLGASGAVELAVAILALEDQRIPPTINLEEPGEGCDLDYVPHRARPHAVEHILSNSFGFGGHNASLVVGRAAGGSSVPRSA